MEQCAAQSGLVPNERTRMAKLDAGDGAREFFRLRAVGVEAIGG